MKNQTRFIKKIVFLLFIVLSVHNLMGQSPFITGLNLYTTSNNRCYPKLEWGMIYTNIKNIEIERSLDNIGFSNIDVIEVINASSSTTVNFTYIDENPFSTGGSSSSTFYYRIKVNYLAGSFWYSSILSISNINPAGICSYSSGRCKDAAIISNSNFFTCSSPFSLNIANLPFQSTPLFWSSSNNAVASVNTASGVISPVTSGTVIIYADLPVCNTQISKLINFCSCDVPTGLGVIAGNPYQLYFNAVSGITNYRLEWTNYSNNTNGTKDIIYTGSSYSFTDIPAGNAFRYRVAPITTCGVGTFSTWADYGLSGGSCATTVATTLIANCTCGPSCATTCGYERFNWSPISGASSYNIEYEVVNLSSGASSGIVSLNAYNVPTVQPIANYWNYAGTNWVIRFRVRPVCSSGPGVFSPWSSNFPF